MKKRNIKNLEKKKKKIGYPVMVKASWGGGGRGMRIVRKPKELIDQLTVAQNEAKKTFGKDEVFIEKYLENAAHIEVQILGDRHGEIARFKDVIKKLLKEHLLIF